MATLPEKFVERMKEQLGSEARSFFDSFENNTPTSIRLHHLKGNSDFADMESIPWCKDGYYLQKRPWFHLDPHWHGGAYYVQEASSMILDFVISSLKLDMQQRVWLDMCAAPGGKSGILARHLGEGDLLIANEVVPQRRSILRENLYKGGYLNTFISGEQPSAFREPIADIVLVDAPCAGEGMMRKEEEAIRQWTPGLVHECAVLQKNIVHDIIRCIKPGGYLLYSTCSYSHEENIDNVSSFLKTLSLQCIPVTFPPEWKIVAIEKDGAVGYQLFPHRVQGEGLFIAVLQLEESNEDKRNSKKPSRIFSNPTSAFLDHVENGEAFVMMQKNQMHAFISREAEERAQQILRLFPRMELLAEAGEIKGKDFIPAHFLPMARLAKSSIHNISLSLEESLDYLERSTTLPASSGSGWHQVEYHGTLLGWAKSTSNGWKNHYPQTWKLRSRKMS